MRMRGVNFGGWFSQVDCIEEKDPDGFPGLEQHMASFLGNQDFALVKQWGLDHVRLPIDYFNLFEEGTLEPKAKAFDLLDGAINQAAQNGLQVILDLHKCPGHDFHLGFHEAQTFFTSSRKREQAKRVWSVLCERFGHYSHVILEILNEPVAPNAEIWNQVKDEMFAYIRQRAPHRQILIGSNRWNSAEQFASLTPVDDDNVLYSFHCYNPVIFTHQKAPWIDVPWFKQEVSWPGVYSKPDEEIDFPVHFGEWNRDVLKASIQPALDFRHQYQVPVACNEFGVFAGVKYEYRKAWLRDFLDILKEADVGYSYWNYKNLDFGLFSVGESLHQDNPEYNQNPERMDVDVRDLLIKE